MKNDEGRSPDICFFDIEASDVRAQRGQSLALRRFKCQHDVLAFVILYASEPKVQDSIHHVVSETLGQLGTFRTAMGKIFAYGDYPASINPVKKNTNNIIFIVMAYD